MRTRKKLTIEDILNKDHYRAILYILACFPEQKIRFLHLRYALAKEHNIVPSPKTQQLLHEFETELKIMPHQEWLINKIEGKRGINNLTNFLEKLIKMDMITKEKEKGERYPSYRLTTFGENVFKRRYIKWMIDWLIPNEALNTLAEKIGETLATVSFDNQEKWDKERHRYQYHTLQVFNQYVQ